MHRLVPLIGLLAVTLAMSSAEAQAPRIPGAKLRPMAMSDLPGFQEDDAAAALTPFLLTCEAISAGRPELRRGQPTPQLLQALCAKTLAARPTGESEAREFFARNFDAFEVVPDEPHRLGGPAFFTGYYEPVVDGALESSQDFSEPLLSRPADLVTLSPEDQRGDLDPVLAGARRLPDGQLVAFPERSQIDAGILGSTVAPVAWVRDAVEAFLIQVQGSAAVRLADGRLVRLTYAGRNGLPYTSIGRDLIERGEITEADMSLARLKQWVRDHGQGDGEPGRLLLQRNKSYVFFSRDESGARTKGPIGAASVPLTPLRSIAVDRSIWPYGLPFWIDANLSPPAGLTRRLMIGQDTGSAIIGPARADLFIGTGDAAGGLAGDIRHAGRMVVFWPREEPRP